MFQTELILFLQSLETDVLNSFFLFWTAIGYSRWTTPMMLVILFGVSFRAGFIMMQAMLWNGMTSLFLKDVFALPRPSDVDVNVKFIGQDIPNSSPFDRMGAKTFFGGYDILGSKEGILKVINKLAELKSNVKLWYRDEGQFQQALQSGEIPMGQYYHDVAGLAAADGHPVRSTFPKEGGVNDSGSWAVSRASKKLEEALVFINYMSRPDIQAKLSRKVGTAPTVRRDVTDLTDNEFASVSSDIEPIIPRYQIYTGELTDWVNQKWTEMVTK